MRLQRVLGVLALAAAVSACSGGTTAPQRSPGPIDQVVRAVEQRIDPASAQGRVADRQFHSASLDRDMPYKIYLPPGYDRDTSRRYPTLYLLHGFGSSDDQWVNLGLATEADRLIRSSQIAPLVVVMPEGENSYWVDHANGGPRWGAYVARDLVREIEGGYRVMPGPRNRAIGGISMGAHGAMQLSLNYPGVFGSVGAHSLVLRRFGSAPQFFGEQVDFEERDPVVLVRERTEIARTLAVWIDIGADDEWAPLAIEFENELNELRITNQWHLWPGGHTDQYWSSHVADYLRYYDAALAGKVPHS